MTNSNVLRQFFKKFFNIDAGGNSPTSVLKDIVDNNEDLGISGGGSSFDLSDRMAKGINDNGEIVEGAVIEGIITATEEQGTTIPPNKASGLYSHAEGISTTASGPTSHAEGSNTTASGITSHAEGSTTTSSGDMSHAEGSSTTASGDSSHAEGVSTTASSEGSHAEGGATTASGIGAHAEGGVTVASGRGAHAEGGYTTASGMGAHAEGGQTTASGTLSHAEGSGTLASGGCSHAEGSATIANHSAQHVFGEFNVADDSTAAATVRGNYVEIVGNGTSETKRSNARTLDWSGNETLAGSLTLGKGSADEVTITAAQLTALLGLLNA